MLRLLKAEIKLSNLSDKEKILTWTFCTLSFFGALRPGESLVKFESHYDPTLTLCKKDVTFVKGNIEGERDAIHLNIKNSKTNKSGNSETIVIYETKDELCPVKATRKFMFLNRTLKDNKPFLMGDNNKPMTLKRMNNILKSLSEKTFKNGMISGHSFRSGLVSMLAKKGYTDSQLKLIGRWSSRAFEVYIKLGRTKCMEMAIEAAKV